MLRMTVTASSATFTAFTIPSLKGAVRRGAWDGTKLLIELGPRRHPTK